MKKLENKIKQESRGYLVSIGWKILHLVRVSDQGEPDTLCLKSGRIVFVEFKVPGEEPRPLQQYRIDELKRMGFTVFVLHSLEETKKSFKQFG